MKESPQGLRYESMGFKIRHSYFCVMGSGMGIIQDSNLLWILLTFCLDDM